MFPMSRAQRGGACPSQLSAGCLCRNLSDAQIQVSDQHPALLFSHVTGRRKDAGLCSIGGTQGESS